MLLVLQRLGLAQVTHVFQLIFCHFLWWHFERFFTSAFLHPLNKVSPRGRRDDMPHADGSTKAAKIASDLRPSAEGSAVHTSLVAGGG